MLENRPIAKKTVYGTGAFAFVFVAAMAGTAFMITGGVGHGGDYARADAPAYQIASTDAWADTPTQSETRASMAPASMVVTAAPQRVAADAGDVGSIVDVTPAPSDASLAGENDTQAAPVQSDDEKTAKPEA